MVRSTQAHLTAHVDAAPVSQAAAPERRPSVAMEPEVLEAQTVQSGSRVRIRAGSDDAPLLHGDNPGHGPGDHLGNALKRLICDGSDVDDPVDDI